MEQIAKDFFSQNIAGCMEEKAGEHGLSRPALDKRLERLEIPLAKLKKSYESGSLPLLRVPEDEDDLKAAREALARLSQGARRIIFFGTGGSGLGGRMLARFAGDFIPGVNEPGGAGKPGGEKPQVLFFDNLDGLTLKRLFANLDLENCRFVMISKSGGTPETLMQGLTAIEAVRKAGLAEKIPSLFLGLTEPYADSSKKNGLRRLCEHFSIPLLDHHRGVGGRYSVLTNVGMLPGMAMGLDVGAIRKGAGEMVEAMLAAPPPMPCRLRLARPWRWGWTRKRAFAIWC